MSVGSRGDYSETASSKERTQADHVSTNDVTIRQANKIGDMSISCNAFVVRGN